LAPPPPPPPAPKCAYKGQKELVHCALFGDPHLKTFGGSLETCRVRGAWPLIENRFLAVQVTNEEVLPGSNATATTKVSTANTSLLSSTWTFNERERVKRTL